MKKRMLIVCLSSISFLSGCPIFNLPVPVVSPTPSSTLVVIVTPTPSPSPVDVNFPPVPDESPAL